MRNFFTLFVIAAVSLAVGCGGRSMGSGNDTVNVARNGHHAEPKLYTFRVVAEHPHSTSNYTQGLQFIDGIMWEGTGQHGESKLLKTDLESGRTEIVAELPQHEFGEGITVLNDKIYQLTWTNNVVHIYDRQTGKKIKNVRYSGEGWGLTTDGTMLYMSNGSERIFRIEPGDFARKSAFTVTLRGEPLKYLNELEWIEGKIWANIYTLDQIVIIDPQTGVVEGIVNLRGLLPDSERTPSTDVLNGIAYDAATGRIFVTGKNWSKLYEIELIEK